MTPERFQEVRRLFEAARELPQDRRQTFLNTATGANPDVIAEVNRLLASHEEAQSFLPTQPEPVRRIGRYLIDRELGRGGMGIVYQATDPAMNRKIALKLIRPGHEFFEDDKFNRDSLLREARAAGPLHHPGIVTIYDVGEAEGVPFVSMELVEGPSLYSVLSAGQRLDRSVAMDVLRQVASALDYAHSRGIIHRDIKPANILLEGGSIAKITDFGIAKIASSGTTLGGILIGTAFYMSPEQIQSQPLDGRSDQFALASMAYELLTGTLPFTGDTATAVSFKIVHEPRPSASGANRDLPAAVDPVFARGLARTPGERFATCAEFVRALESALLSTLRVEPPTRPSEPVPARRSRMPLAVIGALVLTLLVFGIYRMRPAPQPAPAPIAPPPVIVQRFDVGPPSIPSGGVATLSWETSGASEVAIDPGVGSVVAKGTFAVKPHTSTVYLLTAKGVGGSVTARASIEVAQPAKPPEHKTPEPPKSEPPKTESPKPEPTPTVPPQEQANHLYTDAMSVLRAGDSAKAAPLFRQAADLGDARAMNELANLYRRGDGLPRNPSEALKWFTKSAEAGNASAMVFLGSMYAAGDGVLKKPADALRWFHQAADAGNLVAMDAIGQMYWSGNGVPKDDKQAVDWFQKAAAKGNAAALYDLGLAYETGRGVEQDANAARNLFRQSAAAGDARAKARLKP